MRVDNVALRNTEASKQSRRDIIRSELADYTLEEWLALRNVSRNSWYRMERRPKFIRVGSAIRIPREADRAWLEQELQRTVA